MKTIVFTIIILLSICFQIFAQVGKDCNTPYIITSLPFILNNQSTQGMGNEYNETMTCNSLYMTGNDFVFQYTPNQDLNITIKLTNTNVLVGLFLIEGCPDIPTSQCIAKAEASNGNPELSNIPVTANKTYFIIIDTYNVANLFPSTTFNISVDEAHTIDIAPRRFYRPMSGCHLTNESPICIMTRNFGTQAVDTIILGFYLDNQTTIYDTFVYHLPPGGLAYFWFNHTLDLSNTTKHLMTVFSATPNDNNKLNDTLRKWIVHPISISSFPYFEDFENNDGGWTTNWISDIEPGTSWEWGVPQGNVINHAASGSKCWATNLSGNYLEPEYSYIMGPCFNFSQLTLPVIELDIFYKTTTIDIIQLEYSLDSSFTWHRIGNSGEGINWYNTPPGYSESGWNGNSNGWIHAQHTLDGLGGKPYVLLRFSLRGGVNGTDEGVAIDNIRISESPQFDLSIKNILYPYDSCGLSNNENLKFVIQNNGLQAVNNFPVKISINNGQTYITEIVNQSIPPMQSIIYTTQQLFDFSSYGQYKIIVASNLINDENLINDTLKINVMNFPTIINFPYIEDFELNNGYWYSNGMNNSWEWGIPTDTLLVQAGSGSYCWATNLSGYHNLAEESYVTSPCFYLDNLQKPIFKSKIWYEQTYPTYTQVQIKNGTNQLWNILGSSASPNWYNSGYSWTYSSNGWINVKHSLSQFNNGNINQLRFYFKGTIQNAGFSFDKIEICDAPTASFTTYSPNKSGYYVYFQNTSQRFDSCLWDFGDGQFSYSLNPIHQYSSSDSILVKLKVWNKCDIDSFAKYVHPIYISVPENSINSCLNFFYNEGKIYISRSCNFEDNELIVKIFSPQGTELFNYKINISEPITILPINFNSTGIYILNIISNKETSYMKIFYRK